MGFSLSKTEVLTLKAVFLTGAAGRIAFDEWWNAIDFDNEGHQVKRLAPFLHHRAVELGYDGPLRDQLKGLARHTWIVNEIRLKAFPRVLDLLVPCGDVALMRDVDAVVRKQESADRRPVVLINLLVATDRLKDTFGRLTAAGFHAMPVGVDTLNGLDQSELHVASFQEATFDLFEVHWRVAPGIVDPRLAQDMLARAERTQFGQQPIRVLELGDQIFQTLMHGIGARKDGRIYAFIDVAHFASTAYSAPAWAHARALAGRYGAISTISALMRYLRGEMGVAIPGELVASWHESCGSGLD